MDAPCNYHSQETTALPALTALGKREIAEGRLSAALAFLDEIDDEHPVEPGSARLRSEASQLKGPPQGLRWRIPYAE